MRDQRVEGGPPLGGVEPGHGAGVGGVGAEPINRLGGEGDEPAFAQNPRRRLDPGAVGREP